MRSKDDAPRRRWTNHCRWCDLARRWRWAKKARNIFRIMIVICVSMSIEHGRGEKKMNPEKERKKNWNLFSPHRVWFGAAAAVIADSDCVFLMLFLGIVALNMNAARGKCGTKENNKAKVPQWTDNICYARGWASPEDVHIRHFETVWNVFA